MNRQPSHPCEPAPCPPATRTDLLRSRLPRRRVLSLALLLATPIVFGQPYAVDWSTTDAGGGTSGGGDYTLSGTIGQADTAVMRGDSYVLEGGFWPGVIVPSTTEAPTLVLQFTGDRVWVSWSPATPGFRLEQTTDLLAPDWSVAPAGNPVALPLSTHAQFYRLRLP